MKRFHWLLLFLMLISLACGATPTITPTFASIIQPPMTTSPTLLPTSDLSTATPPQDLSTEAIETNPPPSALPAPITSPQPAAAAHHRPGDAIVIDRIAMFDANNGWAISGAEVLVTSDGAQTWHEVTPPATLPSGSQVQVQGAFWDMQNAWIVFSSDNQIAPDAVIWHTRNGGQTWVASAPLNHEAYGDQVWAEFSVLDATHIWLMMRGVYAGAGIHYAAQFFRSTDGGLTWLPLIGDVGVDYTGLVFADSNNGLLTWQTTGAYASSPPEYAVTTDGAVNWDVRELPPPVDAPDLFDISPYCEPYQPHILPDHSIRILVGCFDEYDPPDVFSSYLYSSADGGNTWTSTHLPEKVLASVNTLFLFDEGNSLLLGRDIYNAANNGQSWDYVKSVNWDGQFTFVDPQTGWAVAKADQQIALVKTSNGGRTWIEIKPVIAP